jgi:hypothetical protein
MEKKGFSQKPSLKILFEFGKRFVERAKRNIESAEHILQPIPKQLDLLHE